jgi:putative uncharacterized protein OB3222
MSPTSISFTQEEQAQLWKLTFEQGISQQAAIDQVLSQRPKIDKEEYIFSTLQANAKIRPTAQLNHCVRSTVTQLLEEKAGVDPLQPGLLLGKIQCGKTNAFLNIMALAFDRGIDICIVLTKGVNSLATQTKERMVRDFRYFKESQDLNQPATIYIHDILDLRSHGFAGAKFSSRKGVKLVIVCKKEAKNLAHLTTLFTETSPHLLERKVLVIDDEADFASRNYRQRHGELELANISQQIDDFVTIPRYCRYLQVTATPYSLFLQPDGEIELGDGGKAKPWRPRFTTIVPVHDHYIGGQQYFVESQDEQSMYSHLFHPISEKCIEVLGYRNERYRRSSTNSKNIEGLTDAIISYLLGTAIRSLQEEERGRHYHSSALIHCDIAQKAHRWQYDLISTLIEEVRSDLASVRLDPLIRQRVTAIYKDYEVSNKKGRKQGLIDVSLPTLAEVLQRVRIFFSNGDYKIHIVNSSNDVPNLLDESGQLRLETTVNFFVGGSILDRGITIGNMLCFFYGRDPRRFQMDTVLQHARMFGARDPEDMAVTRFHTTQYIYKVFAKMNAVDDQLRETLISRESYTGDAPLEAIFVGYDKVIRPCASQKIRVAETLVLKSHQRMVPKGFQSGYKTNIAPTMRQLDKMIGDAESRGRKEGSFFKLHRVEALQILELIRETYIYEANDPLQWNHRDMQGAIEYACEQSGEDFVYCLCRTERKMSRILDNGDFSDKPDSGNYDLAPAKKKAEKNPVLMLFRQDGDKELGWNGAPFYWPVLVMPKDIAPVIFSYGTKNTLAPQRMVLSEAELLGNIPSEQVLHLTLASEFFFDILMGDKAEECRELRPTTAPRYLFPDDSNPTGYRLRKDLSIAPWDIRAGVFSHVGKEFPFEMNIRPYMLFRNSRDSSGSLLLVELDPEQPYYVTSERVEDVDVLIDANLQETEYVDDLVLWTINFRIKRIVGFRLNARDQQAYEQFREEEDIE